jgi:hypothetical protein
MASNSPLGTTNALCSLVELGGHIEVVSLRLLAVDTIEDDEGVDLEVGEVEVDVDAAETGEEVYEGVLLLCRDVGQEGVGDGFA